MGHSHIRPMHSQTSGTPPVQRRISQTCLILLICRIWMRGRSVGTLFLGMSGLPILLHTSAVFLQALQALPALPETHIGFLGNVYGFANTPNTRIRLCFYEIALHDPTSSSANVYAKQAAAWVVGKEIDGQTGGSGVKGGMGFCRPIFRALHLVDRDLAERTYLENKMAFHPIARNLIEKVGVELGGFRFIDGRLFYRTLVCRRSSPKVGVEGSYCNLDSSKIR